MATTSQLLEELNRQRLLAKQGSFFANQSTPKPTIMPVDRAQRRKQARFPNQPITAKPVGYDTSFYDSQLSQYEQKQKEDAELAKKEAEAQYGEQLRQAYVSKLQNDAAMQERLAQAGIRGGGTETANLKLMTGYQNTQNKLNADKMSAISGIAKSTNDNIFNFTMDSAARKNAFIEQLESEKRQREYEEKTRKQDRRWAVVDRNLQRKDRKKDVKKEDKKAFYSAKYSTYNSVKSLQNALKKAKTQLEKTVINARIGYLKNKKKK